MTINHKLNYPLVMVHAETVQQVLAYSLLFLLLRPATTSRWRFCGSLRVKLLMLFGRSGYWCWMVHQKSCMMTCWPKPQMTQMHPCSMRCAAWVMQLWHFVITMMSDTWSRRAISTAVLTTYPAWNDQWFQWTSIQEASNVRTVDVAFWMQDCNSD